MVHCGKKGQGCYGIKTTHAIFGSLLGNLEYEDSGVVRSLVDRYISRSLTLHDTVLAVHYKYLGCISGSVSFYAILI